jgi:uncharacterized membrane protein YidH (DUF202 family)
MGRHVGLLLVAAGILIVVLGILVWAGGLSWFDRLPGDIRIDHGNVRVYFPVVSMLLVSVAASVLLTILQYLFRR